MSIAEKLTLIAENEQKVYNAGYEKGKAEGGDNDFLDLRTNGGKNFGYLYCAMNHLITAPVIDTSKGTNFTNFCNGCSALVTIPLIDLSSATNTYNAFNGCSKLQNITFEGTIPISISFSSCSALSDISIENIITTLKDLTGQTAQTLTLHNTVGSKLTDEQKAIITAKNWELVY